MKDLQSAAWSFLRQTQNQFLIIGLLFGLIFVYIVPPLWGLDEPSHFDRAYEIAHGDIIPNRDRGATKVPKNLIELGDYAIGDLVSIKPDGLNSRRDIRDISGYHHFENEDFSKEMKAAPGSSSYSPLAYMGPVIGIFIADIFNADIGHTLLLARIGSLLFYVSIVWIAIYLLRASKVRWLFMVVGLLPAALFQGSVISADGMTISLSILLVALIIRFLSQKSHDTLNKFFVPGLLVVAIALPLVKINYMLLSAVAVLIPNRIFGGTRKAIFIKIGGAIAALFTSFLWYFLSTSTSGADISQRPDGAPISVTGQLIEVLNHPPHFIAACLRSLMQAGDSYVYTLLSQVGWNYINTPIAVTIILAFSIVIAALFAKKEFIPLRNKLILMSCIIVVAIISIFFIMYLAFNPVGARFVDGVQGRYFIPFIIPIIITVSCFIPIRVEMKDKLIPWLFGILSLFGLVTSVVYYLIATY